MTTEACTMKTRRTRAAAREVDSPTPRGEGAPIRLATADQIRVEMSKVYRAAKRGEIPTEVATRLVYILGEIRKTHELTVLEAQVAELESAVNRPAPLQQWRPGLPQMALPAPMLTTGEEQTP